MLHDPGASSLKMMVMTPGMPPIAFGLMWLAATRSKGFHQRRPALCSWAPCLATTRHPPEKESLGWLVFGETRCMATRGAVSLSGMGVLACDRTALGDEAIQTCPCACFVSDRLTSATKRQVAADESPGHL